MKINIVTLQRLPCTALFLLLVFSVPMGKALAFQAPEKLIELIKEGQATNQALKSIEDTVAALETLAPAAGTLDDPRLGIGLSNLPTDSYSFSQEPMTQKQIAISQKVPWFGKLDLKSQAVALKAVRLKTELKAKRLKLTRKISDRYYSLAFIDSSLQTNRQLTDLVSQLLKVSETRYAAGKGLQQDVFQAQVELSKLLDEKLTLLNRRKVMESQINELINRPNFQPVAPVIDVEFPEMDLDDAYLRTLALSKNPWLAAKQIGIEQGDVGIALAQKDYYPNFDFKLAYGQRDDDQMGRDRADFVSGFVTMTVPLWQGKKQAGSLASNKKKKEAAQKAYRNVVAALPHQLSALTEEIRTLVKNFELYQAGLIIQAEQWARSSLAAYGVGKVEFNTMISSQIRLARLQLQAEKYRFSIFKKYAELEEIIGGPFVFEKKSDDSRKDMG